jgi:glycogen(starch) synthase
MTKDQASKRFYRVDSNYDFTAFMDRGQTAAYENRWVFETAWEVCNKGWFRIYELYIL